MHTPQAPWLRTGATKLRLAPFAFVQSNATGFGDADGALDRDTDRAADFDRLAVRVGLVT